MPIEDLWENPTSKHCGIALLYGIVLAFLSPGEMMGFLFMLFVGLTIIIHEIVLLILAMETRGTTESGAYYLAMLLIPFMALVGFVFLGKLKNLLR